MTFALKTIMDAIASEADGIMPNIYAWPAENVTVPCMVVGYPTDMTFDMTFDRGGDEATFPLYLLVGKASDKAARDALSDVIDGASALKATLDGDLGGAVSSARVTNLKIETVTVASIAYLGAVMELEILT